MGQSPSSDSYNKNGKGFPFYQGNADFGNEHPIPTTWCDNPRKIAERNDILLSVRAPIGAINIANEPCCIGRGIAAIKTNERVLRSKYLKHQLLARRSLLESMGTGSTFKAVGKSALGNFQITLFPIHMQQEIENQLESITRCIGAESEILSHLQTLVKSRFIEMFGDPVDNPKKWEKPALDKLFVIGSAKRVYAEEQVSEGIPFLRLGDLTNRIQNNAKSCDLYISEEKYLAFAKKNLVPEPGDILVTARGTMGLCYEIKPDDKFYFQDGMITWLHREPKSPLSAFVVHLFNNDHFIDDLHLKTSGTTVKYLSIKALSMLPTINPPLSLQQEFAAFARQAAKLEFVAQKQIEKLQMLYDSLAQEYFG